MKVASTILAVVVCGAFPACGGHGPETQSGSEPENREMRQLLVSLFQALESIGDKHEEIYDTDVREQMADGLYHGFVIADPDYRCPEKFGMFSTQGDLAVRQSLETFLGLAPRAAESAGLLTAQARFDALQDGSVVTKTGQAYDSFIGHADHLR